MKKLKWAENLIGELNIDEPEDLKKLLKHGFKRVRKNNSTCGAIYINKKRGLVVKNSFQTNKPSRTGTKNIVKTLFYSNSDWFHKDELIIQPLCKPFKHYRLTEKAARVIDRKTRGEFDVHSGNVMLYRGRPVLVDW